VIVMEFLLTTTLAWLGGPPALPGRHSESDIHGKWVVAARHCGRNEARCVYLMGQLQPRVELARGSASCQLTARIGPPIAAGFSDC
jgi:hypothetical protein